MSEFTQWLTAFEQGETRAAEELLPLIYEELRRLAAAQFSRLPPGQTLQATALVHEAWLRLVGTEADASESKWQGRRHFFAAAARAMRNIIVERARRKQCLKHGGQLQRVDLETALLADPMRPEEFLALDEALAQLEAFDPEAAALVNVRFFAGLTQQQAADLLGLSKRTADRLWSFARAFLLKELQTPRHQGGSVFSQSVGTNRTGKSDDRVG
ncbi:MAG: sigma-70 family RNA polymerase sigma factor [Verrucomicrobiae bacterium]|nr:sigma-70 family RNA polymerase sigma factor [Verrucomicrobiae bacterium]